MFSHGFSKQDNLGSSGMCLPCWLIISSRMRGVRLRVDEDPVQMTHSQPTNTPQGRTDRQDSSPKTSSAASTRQFGGGRALGHQISGISSLPTSPPLTARSHDASPAAPTFDKGREPIVRVDRQQSRYEHLAAMPLISVKDATHQPALRLVVVQAPAVPQSQAPSPGRVQSPCGPCAEPRSSPRDQRGLGLGAGRRRGGGSPRMHEACCRGLPTCRRTDQQQYHLFLRPSGTISTDSRWAPPEP